MHQMMDSTGNMGIMPKGALTKIKISFLLLTIMMLIQGYYLWVVADIHRQHVNLSNFPQQLSRLPRVLLDGKCSYSHGIDNKEEGGPDIEQCEEW